MWWTRPRAVLGPALEAVRGAYRRFAPSLGFQTSLLVMRPNVDVPDPAVRFSAWRTESYPWSQAYDARTYAELLATQPDHMLLPAEQRERLLGAVKDVIEAHGNNIQYEFRTDLSMATLLRDH